MAIFNALALCLALFVASSAATFGVDVASYISPSTWSCMRDNGSVDFAIVRAFHSYGKVDTNAVPTIKNARAAGVPYVDAYIFPCFSCGNPQSQVQQTVSALKAGGAQFGVIWLDIEGPGMYWGNDKSANINFIAALAQELAELGVNYGVYTSESQWTPITGGWTGLSSRPLWYAHYDYSPSFNDFYPFGGWTKPAIKQYTGTASLCGIDPIDLDWYP